MHYRDGVRGPRRLEHVEELTKHFAPSMVRFYDTDTITITSDMEPQVAVLKYLGHRPENEGPAGPERRKSWTSKLVSRVTTRSLWTKRT